MKTATFEDVIAVCRQNYKNNCGGCPIRQQCCSPIGYGREGLDKWEKAVIKATGKLIAD